MPANLDWSLISIGLQRFSRWLDAVLLAVLCGLLAQWTWVFVAPASKPPLVLSTGKGTAQLEGQMADLLFAAPDAPQTVEPLNVTLIGAFSGKDGFAIVKVNDRMQVALVGDELLPGALLTAIKPRAITVQRDGQAQDIALTTATGAGDPPGVQPTGDNAAAADASADANAAAKAPGAPVSLSSVKMDGKRVIFTSRELAAAVQQMTPATLFGPIRQAADGGWQLDKVRLSSPVHWLGLRTHDELLAIDNAPIQDANQIFELQQKLQQAGSFQLVGKRRGRRFTLVYTHEE